MSISSEFAGSGPLEMAITSDPVQLASVRDAGEALALRIGFSPQVAGRIALALDEALTNVIKHGYGGQRGRPINIRLDRIEQGGRTGIRVLIRDECAPVDPSVIKGRDLDDIRPGGLGVHLMRTIMDHVDYTPRERGMSLEMVKYLDHGQSGQA